MVGLAASRITFGSYIRGIRTDSHKTPLAAAVHIETSRQTVMRLEKGLPTKLSTADLERLLTFYDVDPPRRAEALSLWREVRVEEKDAQKQGNSRGFWQPYADQLHSHFSRYLRLETVADRVTTHQLVLVHGLLQTAGYRRAVIRIDAEPGLSEVDVERRVELNLRRQERLNDKGFRFKFLLSEAVLRHRAGGPSVMAEQLRHLVDVGRRDNISIRVIPFSVSSHRGLTDLSFTLLEFPPLSSKVGESPMVYIEGKVGALYHGRVDVVQDFREAIKALETVALDERATAEVILRIAKEYEA